MGRVVDGSHRSFLALFGLPVYYIFQLWWLIVEDPNNKYIKPKHLMWALLYLRTYNVEELMAVLVGLTEKW